MGSWVEVEGRCKCKYTANMGNTNSNIIINIRGCGGGELVRVGGPFVWGSSWVRVIAIVSVSTTLGSTTSTLISPKSK